MILTELSIQFFKKMRYPNDTVPGDKPIKEPP